MKDIFYHATYKPFLNSIKKNGLGNTRRKMWSDSKGKGTVYLATDPDVAASFAENAEWLDDVEDYDKYADNIIIIVIDGSLLDKNLLEIDQNNRSEDPTYEYHGIIPESCFLDILEY